MPPPLDRSRQTPPRRGFSLMELLAVVTILGLLAAVVVPRVTSGMDGAEERVCEHHCGQLNAAIENYKVLYETWPSADLNELDTPAHYPDGLPLCPVTGAPYRLDAAGDKRIVGHTDGNHSP